MLVVFDLDGTLADITHRLNYIQHKPKNYKAFHAACVNDAPIEEIIEVFDLLYSDEIIAHKHHDVVICSGRSDEVREQTEAWLRENTGAMYFDLKMRKAGDYRKDCMVKEEMLQEIIEEYGQKPDLVFDDRQQVVDMWRSHGIRVAQVAKGDF